MSLPDTINSSFTPARVTTWFILFLLLVAGFALRYVMVSETEVNSPVRADAAEYFSYAFNMRFNRTYSKEWPFDMNDEGKSVIKEKVEPDALRTPGYPLFVMLFVSGKPLKNILEDLNFAQAVLSTLNILLIFLILRNLVPPVLALSAAFLVAISPHLISMNIYMLSETLFVFTLSLFVLAFIYLLKTGSFKRALVTGLALGITLMVKPTVSYLVWFLLPYTFFVFKPRQAISVCAGILTGYVLIYLPWAARNLLVLGSANPSSLAVESVHNGIYLGFMYDNIPESYGHPYAYVPNFEEVQSMSVVLGMLYERFLEQPMDYIAWYCFEKPRIFLSWDIIQGMGDVFVYPVIKSPYENTTLFVLSHDFMKLIRPVINILALSGMLLVWFSPGTTGLSRKAIDAGRLFSVLFIYFLLVHAATAPLPRYAIPITPTMYCLSMLTLLSAYGFVKRRNER